MQKAIKVEKWDTLGNFPTNKLDLYQVNIVEEKADIKAAFEAALNQEPLRPSFPLSRYFTEEPEAAKVHILIRVSPRESRDRPLPCRRRVAETSCRPCSEHSHRSSYEPHPPRPGRWFFEDDLFHR